MFVDATQQAILHELRAIRKLLESLEKSAAPAVSTFPFTPEQVRVGLINTKRIEAQTNDPVLVDRLVAEEQARPTAQVVAITDGVNGYPLNPSTFFNQKEQS